MLTCNTWRDAKISYLAEFVFKMIKMSKTKKKQKTARQLNSLVYSIFVLFLRQCRLTYNCLSQLKTLSKGALRRERKRLVE